MHWSIKANTQKKNIVKLTDSIQNGKEINVWKLLNGKIIKEYHYGTC